MSLAFKYNSARVTSSLDRIGLIQQTWNHSIHEYLIELIELLYYLSISHKHTHTRKHTHTYTHILTLIQVYVHVWMKMNWKSRANERRSKMYFILIRMCVLICATHDFLTISYHSNCEYIKFFSQTHTHSARTRTLSAFIVNAFNQIYLPNIHCIHITHVY